MSQTQDLSRTASGTTTSYSSGTTCPRTGSYKSSNKYMEVIITVVKGQPFPNGTDGKKTSWTALSTTTDGSRDGFTSVKVAAGTA